jgi:hypothetical protein
MKSTNKWYLFYTNKHDDGSTLVIFTNHLRFSTYQLQAGDVEMVLYKLPADVNTMYLHNSLGAELPFKAKGSPLPADLFKSMVYNTQCGKAHMYR